MPRYPIGNQDFKSLRNEGFLYVDKTSYIIELLTGTKYNFLARPRRFGKSLFLTTLEYFFKGERELFHGLAIDSYPWNWEKYPVIHIDLNGSDYTKSEESLTLKINGILDRVEKNYGLLDESKSITERLDQLIRKLYEKTERPVVVLVDEYDKPIIDTIFNENLKEKYKETLRGFYGVLKSLDKYLKIVFMTGVTKFGQMNIFSGLNNIRDISLSTDFGAVCGITEEELVNNFQEGITELAKEEGTVPDRILEILKEHYDGYHFSKNCVDIYNPYSILNAFAEKEIHAYWSMSGTPSFLVEVLKRKDFNLEKLEGAKVSHERLVGINEDFEDPVALFYQTGYLTIKSYQKNTGSYILGYPNQEVEKAWFQFLLPTFSGGNISTSTNFITDFGDALENGNPKLAIELLEEFTAGISYDVLPKIEKERHFQYIIYIISKLLTSRHNYTKVEEKTSNGRIDLLISTEEFVYIIEIKKDSSAKKALEQIIQKDYPLQFRNDIRKVYLIGINFSTEKQRIEDYIIEEY